MNTEEAFTETGYFFENLLETHPELRVEFRRSLEAGNKPYMWQGLNALPGNFLMMTVAPEPTST